MLAGWERLARFRLSIPAPPLGFTRADPRGMQHRALSDADRANRRRWKPADAMRAAAGPHVFSERLL